MSRSTALRVDQLETAVAALQRTVALLVAGDADPLLTVASAAALCGRDPETVRLWCVRKKLGFHDTQLKRHRIPRSELIAFLVEAFGAENLPFPHLSRCGADRVPTRLNISTGG